MTTLIATVPSIADYRSRLVTELSQRIRKNPRYSLRAFARSLTLSPAYLSRLMSGKLPLTIPVARKIIEQLPLDEESANGFLQSAMDQKEQRVRKTRKKALFGPPTTKMKTLSEDVFEVISSWYHYAIIELTRIKRFRNDPGWIAEKLSITKEQAGAALDRLIRLGIIRQDSDGALKKTDNWFTTTHDVPSEAIRHFHKQVLGLALRSVEEIDVSERDLSAMTFAIDPKKMFEARKMISKFRRRMAAVLSSGPASQVYQLSIQFFPLSK
ncbi:MAG TPA: TIGR02147 family protein [Armatimonadota bacterium]|nr:TIGR02147 family protein [Armatimonadota bacterium]